MTAVVDLDSYDHIIVAFSGGKDSFGCLLNLLDLEVPLHKIELWHHDVDGREGSTLMDWPCTEDYCRQAAAAFSIPIYYSWKAGGFEREMDRNQAPTAPTYFETPSGLSCTGGNGPLGTRGLFPQVSPDLSVRWCSAYLKIDPGASALRGQARFNGKRTLFVTGERAEESTSRARYKTFEPHRSDRRNGPKRRHVDQWRPVHAWSEKDIWDAMKRYRVNPHPAYRLGWGRVSCMKCIFGNDNQWASVRAVDSLGFSTLAEREVKTGKTIKRKLSVVESADRGMPYEMDPNDIAAAMSERFLEPIILPFGTWKLPKGAFGDSCGPT